MKDPISPQLCSVCKELTDRPHEPVQDMGRATYGRETILASATNGCRICHWLFEWLSVEHPNYVDDDGFKVTGHLCFGFDEFENRLVDGHPLKTDILRLRFDLTDGNIQPGSTFEVVLRRATEDTGRAMMQLRPNWDLHGRSTVAVRPDYQSPTTKDPSCFNQMKIWFQTCMNEHTLCHKVLDDASRTLPSRLIHRNENGILRLIETDTIRSDHSQIQYIALSHRWNTDDMPRLLKANHDRYKESIAWNGLPKSFKDTLEISSECFRTPYVWIDALCIIQDDTDDWNKEAALMGKVYQNALCNIGALIAADDRSVGLFTERNTLRTSLCSVVVRWQGFVGKYYGQPDSDAWSTPTLLRRGWVFQERLLSPRSIYFGRELRWECSELQASETFPEGCPAAPSRAPWGKDGIPLESTT